MSFFIEKADIDNAIANKAKGIVICIPDQTMSQAVIDKCSEANLPIAAADGICMKASAYFSADSVGAGSVEVLYDIIGGKEPTMETAVDAIVVTPEAYKDVTGKAAD